MLAMSFVSELTAMQKFWSDEPSTQTVERYDSLTGFDITKYIQTIKINDVSHFIEGNIKAFVTSESNLTEMKYELMGGTLAVTQVLVNDSVSTFTHTNGIISIPVSFSSGQQFTTTVYYSGVPGLSPSPYSIGMKFNTTGVYTLSNPDAGRYYWPCYDHPWDKALLEQHITVRSDWLVAGQGLRTGITDNGDGTKTHHWSMSTPVATYVIGFAAAAFVEYNQTAGTIPIQNFVLPADLSDAQICFSHVPDMISFFSDYYGPYPFEKYGMAGISISPYSAMEHNTMTLLGTSLITSTYSGENTIVHELGHQWFGGAVTPASMVDVWLKEGFAVYSEFLFKHHYYGWTTGLSYLWSSIQNYFLSYESSHPTAVMYNPPYNNLFSAATYEKGASVIHMMRLRMGSPTFENFIHTWFNTYNGSNVVSAEFEAMAEQVSGKDFTQFFRQWVYNPGIPSAKLIYFTNNSQLKVIGQTTSSSTTPFDIDIPLRLANSALLDSVVVRANAEGCATVLPFNPATDNLENIQIDPNHWVLNRGFSTVRMQLSQCLPANHRVTLSWTALPCPLPLAGYNVYRRRLPDQPWTKLNLFPLASLTYTDVNALNGVSYEYYVKAQEQGGFESLPSNSMTATPLDFPFDWGFLVVDETRDGTGTIFAPTDQMVDDFYTGVLNGMAFTQWDYASAGAPTLSTLSHYPLVLWHCDDYNEFLLDDNLSTLGSYVTSGGKLLISGWKTPSALPQTFFDHWYPGVVPAIINNPVLISARSDFYADLYPDSTKISPLWNNMFSMSYVFPGANQVLYTAEVLDSLSGHGEPVAIRADNVGTMVLLGFPLYYFREAEVYTFLHQLLPQLYANVGIPEEEDTPLPRTITCYPNPFAEELQIRLPHKAGGNSVLEVYNLKGQKLRIIDLSGKAAAVWDGRDNAHRSVSNGIYLIQIKDGNSIYRRRVTLIR